jgi:hypothetical protein
VTQPLKTSQHIKTYETQEVYTNEGTRTPTHTLETLEARQNPGDTATHIPQHARGSKYQYKIQTHNGTETKSL